MRKVLLFVTILLGIGQLVYGQYRLKEAFPGLVFEQPVDLQHAGDGSGKLYVVEQPGKIFTVTRAKGQASRQLFLDITDRVAFGGEMGLLGLAFAPDFQRSGLFYLNYTRDNPRQTIISRFKALPGAAAADPGSERILLTVDQPYSNHNGGQISFGPDGYLYIGLGDGGSGGDPQNHGQNLNSLLGKILRIDVAQERDGRGYAIPPDNPFAGRGSGFRAEIYAWGLRNPWRFSFAPDGRLWCADVGQNAWEEIDIIRKGSNYGWKIREGFHCFSPTSGCDTTGLIDPVYEYGHDEAGGYSITGGYSCQGPSLPALRGHYIFADFVSCKIWALDESSLGSPQVRVRELLTAPAGISSFGLDAAGELYICTFNGKIYNLAPVGGRKSGERR